MKQKLLLLGTLFLMCETTTYSQTKKAYAVTGDAPGSMNWVTFREIDLSDGRMIATIYSPQENEVRYDALTGRVITTMDNNKDAYALNNLPNLNNNLVAATAFDEANNRLFYTTMKGSFLGFFELKNGTAKHFIVQDQPVRNFESQPGEASVFTRMTIGANGFGYALTNDGNHLVRFSTRDKIMMKDLGSLKDGENNHNHSVHNFCSGWGGDMVSDANGMLYLFTMKGLVYQINPSTLITNYLGTIKNLPASFSVNAVAVNEEGKLVLGCANAAQGLYTLHLNNFEAEKLDASNFVKQHNISDLASGYLLNSSTEKEKNYIVSESSEMKVDASVNIWPNPVQNRIFTIQFNHISGENFVLQLTDMAGRPIMEKKLNLLPNQTETVLLSQNILNGNYIVKVIDRKGEVAYTGKLVVD
jgi:hypothetical protein